MKILTGSLRGRTLRFRDNPHLRPTADKVRKAIFDRLQGQVADKTVLDLFSGTGALGFEALSECARRVTFVELNADQAEAIRENLKPEQKKEYMKLVQASCSVRGAHCPIASFFNKLFGKAS